MSSNDIVIVAADRSHRDEMRRRDAKKGIASLCIGGGMGVALTVER